MVGLSACDNDVLNLTPPDQMSPDAVFTDPALATAFLNDIYIGMDHGLREIQLGSMADETHFIHNYDTRQVVEGIVNPGSRGAFARGEFNKFDWQDNYSRIRQANTFLEGVESATFDPALRDRLKGEALFLRAYFYHNLLRIFGGVPLVTKVYQLNDDFTVARNSFQETVEFIVADADAAAALLPESHSGANLGRATKGAAMALKARTLLYAASDLYVQNPSGMAETGYTGSVDQTALYQRAKDAAKAIIDSNMYALFRPEPASQEEAAVNYQELFLQRNSSETILNRYFLVTRGDGYDPGIHNGPNGYHNWGGNTPIQQLIDDYRMADGSAFSWSNPAHASAPYENREPRFYASILYDGAQWRQRPSDAVELDPYGIVQTFRELDVNGTIFPGLDTRNGPIENWNGGYTGYYLKKFIDPTVNAQFDNQTVPWPFFRYTEVLMNYVEAAIKTGDLPAAVETLNQIRQRAGMPAFPAGLSAEQLWAEYVAERRIEMAFEEQRYFDVRRWMTAPTELNEPARGIEIKLTGTSRTDRSTWGNYTYTVFDVQPRAWNNALYFAPIPSDEINRNDLLVQNPGY